MLGFSNSKIEGNVDPDLTNKSKRAERKKTKTSEGRGGKPTNPNITVAPKVGFYPQLLQQHEARKNPEPVCIQADIVRAFFGDLPLDLAGGTFG